VVISVLNSFVSTLSMLLQSRFFVTNPAEQLPPASNSVNTISVSVGAGIWMKKRRQKNLGQKNDGVPARSTIVLPPLFCHLLPFLAGKWVLMRRHFQHEPGMRYRTGARPNRPRFLACVGAMREMESRPVRGFLPGMRLEQEQRKFCSEGIRILQSPARAYGEVGPTSSPVF
jgi:hypothetical protein